MKTPTQIQREKLYARTSILAKELGFEEPEMRRAFVMITGKESRKEMSLDDLFRIATTFTVLSVDREKPERKLPVS